MLFCIHLNLEFLPVLEPLTRWCATLGTALGLVSRWVEGFVNWVHFDLWHSAYAVGLMSKFLHRLYHAQSAMDPPAQSHASYEVRALPPTHFGWMTNCFFLSINVTNKCVFKTSIASKCKKLKTVLDKLANRFNTLNIGFCIFQCLLEWNRNAMR